MLVNKIPRLFRKILDRNNIGDVEKFVRAVPNLVNRNLNKRGHPISRIIRRASNVPTLSEEVVVELVEVFLRDGADPNKRQFDWGVRKYILNNGCQLWFSETHRCPT